MFIKNLDFLNSPPQLYFLEKNTNKTLFGGILFIIYFLLMLTIFIFYLLDYCLNAKYEISYSLYKYYNDSTSQINEILHNFQFTFDLKKTTQEFNQEELSHNFILMDSDFNILERNKSIIPISNDLTLFLTYICIGNCSLENFKDDLFYSIQIKYPGYKIEHQNEKTPLIANSSNITFDRLLTFSFNKFNIYNINFEMIKYREEKGLLGLFDNWMNKINEHSCVDIISIDKFDSNNIPDIVEELYGIRVVMKILSAITFNNENHQIEEYVRKRRSPLDVLANIGSLFSTFLTAFSFFYNFYSKKNNNYTIIKELLSSQRIFINSSPRINILKSKTIKFENNSKRNKNYLNLDKKSIDTSKSVPFKSEENNINITNKKISRNNNQYLQEQEQQKNENIHLKEIFFMDFLLKNFICKKNKKKKNYIIIDISEEIICKYTSVETILYNQIMFENLLKDYIWNKPFLGKISYNFMIQKLKSIS